MAKRKKYSKPEIIKVVLDRSINLMFYSPPNNPGMMPPKDGIKGTDPPFKSPFDDKPFT
jgi:hypothetical protein